jgi:hypothetical protein
MLGQSAADHSGLDRIDAQVCGRQLCGELATESRLPGPRPTSEHDQQGLHHTATIWHGAPAGSAGWAGRGTMPRVGLTRRTLL